MRVYAHPPIQVKEAFSLPGLDLTDAKVSKAAHAVLGIASFFVANILVGYGGIIALLSLPIYLISLACAIRFFQGKSYSNEKQLEDYREKALTETFAETLRLHGLANIFQFDLLPRHQLKEKLQAHLTTLKPEAVALLYLEVKKATENFESFSPIFVVAMEQAMGEIKVSVLFENPHIKIILSSGLISQDFEEAHMEYCELKKAWRSNCTLLQDEFSIPFLRILGLFESHVAPAVSDDKEAQLWMCRVRQDIPKLKRMKCAAEALPENYPLLQDCHGTWADIRFVTTTHQKLLDTFHEGRKTYLDRMYQEKQHFEREVAVIDRRFE